MNQCRKINTQVGFLIEKMIPLLSFLHGRRCIYKNRREIFDEIQLTQTPFFQINFFSKINFRKITSKDAYLDTTFMP